MIATGVPDGASRSADYFLHGTTVGAQRPARAQGRAGSGCSPPQASATCSRSRRGDRAERDDASGGRAAAARAAPPAAQVARAHPRRRHRRRRRSTRPRRPRRAAAFRDEGVECVAVVFINSHANPTHELARRARRCATAGFDGRHLALAPASRASTASTSAPRPPSIDAYVRPQCRSYLARLESTLRERGLRGRVPDHDLGRRLRWPSRGARSGRSRPSCPAPWRAPSGAGDALPALGIGTAVTADVGGTSFDTCLIVDGRPRVHTRARSPACRYRRRGSTSARSAPAAARSPTSTRRAAPRRAAQRGRAPGPAATGAGGTEPTVTDAAVRARHARRRATLAGGLQLDVDARAAARSSRSPSGSARRRRHCAPGILTIAAASMADAIREVTLEQGERPARRRARRLRRRRPAVRDACSPVELDIEQIVVPPHAGNFSALGPARCRTSVQHRGADASRPLDAPASSVPGARSTALADAARGARSPRARRQACSGRRRSTCASWARSTRSRLRRRAAPRSPTAMSRPCSSVPGEYRAAFGHVPAAAVELVSLRVAARSSFRALAEVAAPTGESVRSGLEAYSFTAWRHAAVRCARPLGARRRGVVRRAGDRARADDDELHRRRLRRGGQSRWVDRAAAGRGGMRAASEVRRQCHDSVLRARLHGHRTVGSDLDRGHPRRRHLGCRADEDRTLPHIAFAPDLRDGRLLVRAPRRRRTGCSPRPRRCRSSSAR